MDQSPRDYVISRGIASAEGLEEFLARLEKLAFAENGVAEGYRFTDEGCVPGHGIPCVIPTQEQADRVIREMLREGKG